MKKIINRVVSSVIVVLIFQGCGSVRDFRRGQIYDARIFAFEQAIRWGEYEKAEAFVNMREGKPKKLDLEYLKNIRVTKLNKIKEKQTLKDENEIVLEIQSVYEIEYYVVSINVVKAFRYEQNWWFSKELDTWFGDNELPDFGG